MPDPGKVLEDRDPVFQAKIVRGFEASDRQRVAGIHLEGGIVNPLRCDGVVVGARPQIQADLAEDIGNRDGHGESDLVLAERFREDVDLRADRQVAQCADILRRRTGRGGDRGDSSVDRGVQGAGDCDLAVVDGQNPRILDHRRLVVGHEGLHRDGHIARAQDRGIRGSDAEICLLVILGGILRNDAKALRCGPVSGVERVASSGVHRQRPARGNLDCRSGHGKPALAGDRVRVHRPRPVDAKFLARIFCRLEKLDLDGDQCLRLVHREQVVGHPLVLCAGRDHPERVCVRVVNHLRHLRGNVSRVQACRRVRGGILRGSPGGCRLGVGSGGGVLALHGAIGIIHDGRQPEHYADLVHDPRGFGGKNLLRALQGEVCQSNTGGSAAAGRRTRR